MSVKSVFNFLTFFQIHFILFQTLLPYFFPFDFYNYFILPGSSVLFPSQFGLASAGTDAKLITGLEFPVKM